MKKDTYFCVYRMYDENDRILYAGATGNLMRRIGEHRHDKRWFRNVRTIRVTPHPTLASARAAEAEILRMERPIHNVHHSGRGNKYTTVERIKEILRIRSSARLATALGVSRQAIYYWERVGGIPYWHDVTIEEAIQKYRHAP